MANIDVWPRHQQCDIFDDIFEVSFVVDGPYSIVEGEVCLTPKMVLSEIDCYVDLLICQIKEAGEKARGILKKRPS